MGLFNSTKNTEVFEPVKANKLGKLYCIDFENTQDNGIIGISKLKENDEVVIFYGSNNNSISFVSHEMIVLANCKVTIVKCERSAKNYLDFQLVSYLGMRLGKENFEKVVIVSKDQGYEAVVDFWLNEKVDISLQHAIDPEVRIDSVKRNEIKKEKTQKVKSVKTQKTEEKEKTSNKKKNNGLPDSIKKKVRNAVKDEDLKPTQYTVIYNTILHCKNLEEYEKNIKKRLGDKGDSVNSKTANIFTDYIQKVQEK